jgi:hypothetical protein
VGCGKQIRPFGVVLGQEIRLEMKNGQMQVDKERVQGVAIF